MLYADTSYLTYSILRLRERDDDWKVKRPPDVSMEDTDLERSFAFINKSLFLSYGRLDIFFQIFVCRGEHQLDSVKLVDLAGTWIIVDSYDIGFRMKSPEFLNDFLSDYMIRQTGKRLGADDVPAAFSMSSSISRLRTSLHRSGYQERRFRLPWRQGAQFWTAG